MSNFVSGVGPKNAKLIILGEAPGYYEDKEKQPFVGPSGNLLNKILSEVGLDRSEVYLTNVVKYRPPMNDFKRVNEVCNYDEQLVMLRNEINAINPNCILNLGVEAVKATTGKTYKMKDIRGSILPSYFGPKTVSTYHPAALLRSGAAEGISKGALPYWLKYIVRFDFQRAVEQSNIAGYNPPSRTLRICRSSADLHNYLHRYSDKEYNAVDIEALNCVPNCIAFALSKYDAISIPLFQSLFGIQLTTMPHSDLAQCWEMIGRELSGPRKKIGQNFKYDQDKKERLGFKVNNFHADTMLIAATLNPEWYKSLAFLTSIYTEQPYYKDEGKSFSPKKDRIEKLLEYNCLDSAITLEIFLEQLKELEEEGLKDFYFNYYHLFHNLYLEIENRGLRIDYEKRNFLHTKYSFKCKQLLSQLQDILRSYNFDPAKFNPRSPKQVAFALYDVLGIPRRAGTGEEILFALLANTVKDERKRIFIRSELDYRKCYKTDSTYIQARPDYDKRMRTSYRIAGTETGRTSTSILEAPIRPDNIGIALQTMTKHGEIGSELRSQYIPDEGMIFLEIDLSQAEPRIVALLSRDDELLSKFGAVDIHCWTAELMLTIPMDQVKKGTGERHIGKTGRNAGNYNVGKREFMINCNTMAAKYEVKDWQDISEWRAGKYLDRFHEFTPKVREVFHADIRNALESSRTLVNPFGRRRVFWNNLQDEKTFKEANAQLPQSTVRDQVGHAMLDAKKEIPDLMILLEMHDAFLCQVPIKEVETYAKFLIGLMERPIDFGPCTLSRGILYPKADAQVGMNWKDLEDLKL